MNSDPFSPLSKPTSAKKKFHPAWLLVLVLLGLVPALWAITRSPADEPTRQPPAQAEIRPQSAVEQPATGVVYFKKQAVYKRVLPEAELGGVRSSAASSGYQALAAISPDLIASPQSIRSPQFLVASELRNYQALSTLGTQAYFSNPSVSQFLGSLANQPSQVAWNAQQSLSALRLQQQQANLNYQLYVQNFEFQQMQTRLNFQTYLNDFNLNNQNYLRNWNTFSNPTFAQPSFYTPPVQLYTPTFQFYTPPVQLYTPPIQFYSPPPTFNFP